MGWKVFRKIARPFEQAAHRLGLSGGGVTRSVMRQGSRSSRDVWNFSYRAVKNVGAGTASMATLGIVKPKWSGTKTASKIGQAVGITAAAVGTAYAAAPLLTIAPVSAAPLTGVPLATAAPFAVETGVSYGAIGGMGSGLAAGTVPLASEMTAASAAAIAAANAPVVAAPAIVGVSAPEAAAITGQGAWVEPAVASKGFLTTLGEKAVTSVVMGAAATLGSQLLARNAPAAGSAGGYGASDSMPLLADPGAVADGGSADDILNRFKSPLTSSPLATVAIVATVLLLTYAVYAKRSRG